MARPPSLTPTSSGVYYRQIGFTQTKSQPRFNLGTNKSEALARNAKLEELWRLVRERAINLNDLISWDEVTLEIAKQIAAGATKFVIGPNPEMCGADSYLHWVARYAEAFGKIIPIVPADSTLYLEGIKTEENARQTYLLNAVKHAEIAYPANGGQSTHLPTGQTLHQGLSAFREHIRATQRNHESVTEWGERLIDQITFLERHSPDTDLGNFGLAAMDAILETVRLRPLARTHSSKGKRQISLKYARNIIKTFRRFVRWLHLSEQFTWRKPADYEVTPIKIPKTNDERANTIRAMQVATYSIEELVTLWRYAHPMERVFMTLALNCGFGRGELTTLRNDDVRLHLAHPHAEMLGLVSSSTDSWVMRLRPKTDVYSEWKLWQETVAALEWYSQRRPRSDREYLLLNAKGRPFNDRTAGNNSNAQIANAWERLTERVRKDDSGFRELSFNKLRKTAINQMRKDHGGEIASLFSAHGSPFAADNLIEVYSNKPFARLHEAISALGRWLQPMWDSVARAFPPEWTESGPKGGPNISRATIDRIVDLKTSGKKIAEIVREVGVSRETIRRWIQRSQ